MSIKEYLNVDHMILIWFIQLYCSLITNKPKPTCRNIFIGQLYIKGIENTDSIYSPCFDNDSEYLLENLFAIDESVIAGIKNKYYKNYIVQTKNGDSICIFDTENKTEFFNDLKLVSVDHEFILYNLFRLVPDDELPQYLYIFSHIHLTIFSYIEALLLIDDIHISFLISLYDKSMINLVNKTYILNMRNLSDIIISAIKEKQDLKQYYKVISRKLFEKQVIKDFIRRHVQKFFHLNLCVQNLSLWKKAIGKSLSDKEAKFPISFSYQICYEANLKTELDAKIDYKDRDKSMSTKKIYLEDFRFSLLTYQQLNTFCKNLKEHIAKDEINESFEIYINPNCSYSIISVIDNLFRIGEKHLKNPKRDISDDEIDVVKYMTEEFECYYDINDIDDNINYPMNRIFAKDRKVNFIICDEQNLMHKDFIDLYLKKFTKNIEFFHKYEILIIKLLELGYGFTSKQFYYAIKKSFPSNKISLKRICYEGKHREQIYIKNDQMIVNHTIKADTKDQYKNMIDLLTELLKSFCENYTNLKKQIGEEVSLTIDAAVKLDSKITPCNSGTNERLKTKKRHRKKSTIRANTSNDTTILEVSSIINPGTQIQKNITSIDSDTKHKAHDDLNIYHQKKKDFSEVINQEQTKHYTDILGLDYKSECKKLNTDLKMTELFDLCCNIGSSKDSFDSERTQEIQLTKSNILPDYVQKNPKFLDIKNANVPEKTNRDLHLSLNKENETTEFKETKTFDGSVKSSQVEITDHYPELQVLIEGIKNIDPFEKINCAKRSTEKDDPQKIINTSAVQSKRTIGDVDNSNHLECGNLINGKDSRSILINSEIGLVNYGRDLLEDEQKLLDDHPIRSLHNTEGLEQHIRDDEEKSALKYGCRPKQKSSIRKQDNEIRTGGNNNDNKQRNKLIARNHTIENNYNTERQQRKIVSQKGLDIEYLPDKLNYTYDGNDGLCVEQKQHFINQNKFDLEDLKDVILAEENCEGATYKNKTKTKSLHISLPSKKSIIDDNEAHATKKVDLEIKNAGVKCNEQVKFSNKKHTNKISACKRFTKTNRLQFGYLVENLLIKANNSLKRKEQKATTKRKKYGIHKNSVLYKNHADVESLSGTDAQLYLNRDINEFNQESNLDAEINKLNSKFEDGNQETEQIYVFSRTFTNSDKRREKFGFDQYKSQRNPNTIDNIGTTIYGQDTRNISNANNQCEPVIFFKKFHNDHQLFTGNILDTIKPTLDSEKIEVEQKTLRKNDEQSDIKTIFTKKESRIFIDKSKLNFKTAVNPNCLFLETEKDMFITFAKLAKSRSNINIIHKRLKRLSVMKYRSKGGGSFIKKRDTTARKNKTRIVSCSDAQNSSTHKKNQGIKRNTVLIDRNYLTEVTAGTNGCYKQPFSYTKQKRLEGEVYNETALDNIQKYYYEQTFNNIQGPTHAHSTFSQYQDHYIQQIPSLGSPQTGVQQNLDYDTHQNLSYLTPLYYSVEDDRATSIIPIFSQSTNLMTPLPVLGYNAFVGYPIAATPINLKTISVNEIKTQNINANTQVLLDPNSNNYLVSISKDTVDDTNASMFYPSLYHPQF